ncbi:NudC domain-containing protein 2 [Babesia sp. Xinjiang]|uniref:NudC domain-containing protein 2 n=1 Tax=Babesia sp. Xinjiang TaxID=462227 RepID=UPI000A21671B|nr:NudC domain-containing protein 2 [Babesia sp. Xinjiang]ORM40512.1 NudC domain-containing protein 2 [Babesia sp. Xinjiang]
MPEGSSKSDISVNFSPKKLSISIEGSVELQGVLCQAVDTAECIWVVDEGKLEVHLTKALKGEVWSYVFEGDTQLTDFHKEADKKRILLERFRNEYPGFDFSGAEFNGMVPEPRTFMKDI